MIEPFLKDDAFIADVRSTAQRRDGLRLWWLGQSGFLLQFDRAHLLLDPYLSDSLTEKYAATDKPNVRMTARVVAPEKLDFIDAVTSSHNHTDHLDAQTLKPLIKANPWLKIVCPEANRAFVADRLGIAPHTLRAIDVGASVRVGPFDIHAVPAAHNDLERDDAGRHKFLGYVVRVGPFTIYHSGDTLRFPGMVDTLARWKFDLALLPINGDRPERKVAGNLDGPQAADLAHDIAARLVIPCHYEMFEFNTASPDQFVAQCQAIGQRYRLLRCGEKWSSDEGSNP